MYTALFRYLLGLIVLVNLTSGPLCVDTQCSTEAETCCSLEDEVIPCVEDACEDDHATSERPDDHCASCSHCSVSVVVSQAIVTEEVAASPLATKILIEHTLSGWVSLPERPPSQA